MSASDAIQLAFTQTWQIVALVLLVYFVSKTVVRRSVHFAHVLWLVVLVKCLVPPILSSPAGLFCRINFSVAETEPFEDDPLVNLKSSFGRDSPIHELAKSNTSFKSQIDEPFEQADPKRDDTADNNASVQVEFNDSESRLAQFSLIAWLSGTAIVFSLLFTRTTLCFFRIRKAGLAENECLTDLVAQLRRDLKIKRPVRILITECRIGPLVYGLLRPTILIPRLVFERSSTSDLVPILTHELIHVRRGDLWINLIQILTNAVWWFNPLVWLANRNVSRVAESCCDEQTVASLDCSAKEYARSLLKILELKRSLSLVPAFPGIRPVEITSKRLERIMKLRQGCHKRTPKWCWAVMIALMLVSLPGAVHVLARESETDSQATELLSPKALSAATTPPFTPDEIMRFKPGTPQITIETRFVTLPEKASRSIGIDWSYLQAPPRKVVNETAKRETESQKRKTPRQPQGRSQTVIETNEPVKYAILTSEQSDQLLGSLHGNRSANVLQAPKVTLFNLQTASISDSSQRPFVVGFRDDDHQLQVVSEGTVIDCRPEALNDGAVWLDLTATFAEVRGVRESTITKPKSSEKFTVQIPEVQRTAIGVELKIPAEQTLVLAGTTKQNSKKQTEQLLVIIRPQVLPSDQLNAKHEPNVSDDEPLGSPGTPWDLSLEDCIRIAMQNSKNLIAINLNTRAENGTTLIAPLRTGRNINEIEGSVRSLLSEVVKSYWELYFYYQNLDGAKTGRDQALVTWREVVANEDDSGGKYDATSVEQSREHFFFFRGRTEEAKRDLLKAERQLRYLTGLTADERIIRPSDKPTEVKMGVDWDEARNEALQNSVQIKTQRQRIFDLRKQLQQQWDTVLPQLDSQDVYGYLGLGKSANNDFAPSSFARIITDKIAKNPESSLGLVLSMPIGLRSKLSDIRLKQLKLARSEAILQDLKLEQTHSLSDAIQSLHSSFRLMETAAMQVQFVKDEVEATRGRFETGNVTLDFVFDAQRRQADAHVGYIQSLLQYTFSIIEVHCQKGTLLPEYKYKVVSKVEG